MGLCALCEQSLSSKVLVDDTLFHHDYRTFRQSVESKCYICSHVWSSLTEEQKETTMRPTFDGIDYDVSLRTSYGERQGRILATIDFKHGDDLFDCEDYNEVGGKHMADAGRFAILNPHIYPVREVPVLAARTNHPSCWSTVSKWIEDCCSKHGNCRVPQEGSWLPTRLVDLLRYDKGRIRVVNSSRLPRRKGISYVALSHCWGRKPFLVMRNKNRKKFKKGVPVSSLASNFQEAIAVARQLGFRYIWIDSLCIIQGSEQDWRREAPTMNQVYRNAFLTIGAMASSDAHGGLFRRRDPEMMGSTITINTEEDGVMTCLLVKSDIWESHVKEAPLSQRAWVVQERMLAPRSLYFCEGQLFWECREQHACELLPNGVPTQFISELKDPTAVDTVPIKAFVRAVELANAHGTYAYRVADDDIPWENVQHEDPYMVWNDVVESYARCALTNPSDKLVAISGVVKDFAKAIDDEYLAGLWRRDFINGLLWMATPESRGKDDFIPAVRSEVYRAPSWSWASLDAPTMRMPRTRYQWYGDYAEVLDVGIELAAGSKDPTGALRHACLHISGHLIPVRRKPVLRESYRYFGSFVPDVEEFEGERFFCLPLREDLVGKIPHLMGLVLTPWVDDGEREMSFCSTCAGKRKFQRVGMFESEKGDPLHYLSMSKPEDWIDWGEESDHLWYPEDMDIWDFIII
ncbi:hypothetical protein KVR01_003905 [Diaporthe batatas]|uniref:uncharacterized protein n=1 Tax=Diaporthe batatas TaxID=748121 RepID=UPI001D0456A3|nr:uncharacterized protein KVR01_003905 [Diaporthe batatas]KAG8168216.1 hypothetical protein KVR01_003905 [Diaporthe batatas]